MKLRLLFAVPLLALAGCTMPGEATAVPGETHITLSLQSEVQDSINHVAELNGYPAGGRIVNTKFVRMDGETLIEHWTVACGDQTVVYEVHVTPRPQGGSAILVAPLKADAKG